MIHSPRHDPKLPTKTTKAPNMKRLLTITLVLLSLTLVSCDDEPTEYDCKQQDTNPEFNEPGECDRY